MTFVQDRVLINLRLCPSSDPPVGLSLNREPYGSGGRGGRVQIGTNKNLEVAHIAIYRVTKKKLLTERAEKALKDKIAQGPRIKVAQMAKNFGLSIL